jgi:2-oxoglutarate dehydrogenase E2 component (dihydrolipoamide succinyltransferase)
VTSIQMPQLGETIVEGTILKWLKQEGDPVERDEPLFEISTDKVDTEVPSPVAGTLTKIVVAEGQTVPVGTELAVIDAGDDASGSSGSAATEPTPPPSSPETSPPPPAPEPVPSPPVSAPVPSGAGIAASVPDRGPRSQILSPLVRKMAAENGLDLAQVAGTGTGGRITKKDVEAAIAAGAPGASSGAPRTPAAAAPAQPLRPVPSPAAPGAGEEVVPMTHIRKAIATHMVGSIQATARAWTMVEVNMEQVVRVRERAKGAFREREGINLTYTPFVTRATTEALLAFPMVNAELRGEDLVLRRYVNMGIAVSYDEGLIVPVVKGTDTMNLVGVARAIDDLANRARAKKLQPDEVQGATFSITNPGPFGSILSLPIINTPNTAILAFDAIEKRPVVIDDAIAIRHMVYLSMSWDHRVIDGALASQFLARVKQNLETWDWAEDLGV